MCTALRHRGPDSTGVHVEDSITLGIQRLRVIDLVTGDQPVFNEDRSVAVVLNGEIYNFRELRARLEKSGHAFRSHGDTEVIAHLYEDEGVSCFRSLHGMFAVAIWDRHKQQLVLGRDRVGKKPLVYHHSPEGLTFASELQALKRLPTVSTDLDPFALAWYFAVHYIPAPLTVFRDVRKLPPASTLVYRAGGIEIDRYWSLSYRHADSWDSGDTTERIRAGLRSSVKRRLVSDVPMGAFLSGGIDSAAVVATMAELAGQVKTFSIGFEHEGYNELPHARQVAQQFGTDHYETVVKADAVEMLPKMVRHYGEPFGGSSALPSFYLAEMASNHVTVALNGDGGDECFGGYPRYVINALAGRLERVPRWLLEATGKLGSRIPSASDRSNARNRLRRLASTLAMEPDERYARYLNLGASRC